MCRGASQTLAVNGLSYVGKDTLYSGASGIPFSAYIFMGPVFYQKLKHMVMDTKRALKSINWEAKLTIEEGIKKLIKKEKN